MVRDTANDHSEPTEAEQSATVNEELSSEIGLHALTARVTSRCFMAFWETKQNSSKTAAVERIIKPTTQYEPGGYPSKLGKVPDNMTMQQRMGQSGNPASLSNSQ